MDLLYKDLFYIGPYSIRIDSIEIYSLMDLTSPLSVGVHSKGARFCRDLYKKGSHKPLFYRDLFYKALFYGDPFHKDLFCRGPLL